MKERSSKLRIAEYAVGILAMVMAMLQFTGISVHAETITMLLDFNTDDDKRDYNSKKNGIQWSSNGATVDGKYYSGNVLILDGADVEADFADGILLPANTTVVTVSDSRISAADYGIKGNGSLSFAGKGTLTIHGCEMGIKALGDLNNSGKIIAVVQDDNYEYGYGIFCAGTLNNSGIITAYGKVYAVKVEAELNMTGSGKINASNIVTYNVTGDVSNEPATYSLSNGIYDAIYNESDEKTLVCYIPVDTNTPMVLTVASGSPSAPSASSSSGSSVNDSDDKISGDKNPSELPAQTVTAKKGLLSCEMKVHSSSDSSIVNQKFLTNYYAGQYSKTASAILTKNVDAYRTLTITENGSKQTLTWKNIDKQYAGPVYAVVYNQTDKAYMISGTIDSDGTAKLNDFILRPSSTITMFKLK